MASFRSLAAYSDGVPGATDRLLFETPDDEPRGVAPATLMADKVNTGSTGHEILEMWRGSQAEFDALGVYSDTTLYVIVG